MPVAFTVPQDVFHDLATRVSKITEKRNTIPILSNVLITADGDGHLSIEATDLDIWARAESTDGAATIETPGSTTVPAGMLADILRKVGKGAQIRFQSDGSGRSSIRAGRAEFKLHDLPAVDFPDMPGVGTENRTAFAIKPAQLKRIVHEVGFAISTEETRYYLNGIFFHADAETGRLVTVATDGHRLSRLSQEIASDIAGMAGIIVPRKMVGLLPSIADRCDEGEEVAIECDAGRIMFTAPSLRVVSKLIDGTFPDYSRVIPQNNQFHADLVPSALEEAVDRVRTVSAERGRGMKFSFGEDGTLRLSVNAPDAGEGLDEIEFETEGERFDVEIGFNGQYVLDALKSFSTTRVRLAMADPGAPALLTIPTDEHRLVVLMPMRV